MIEFWQPLFLKFSDLSSFDKEFFFKIISLFYVDRSVRTR